MFTLLQRHRLLTALLWAHVFDQLRCFRHSLHDTETGDFAAADSQLLGVGSVGGVQHLTSHEFHHGANQSAFGGPREVWVSWPETGADRRIENSSALQTHFRSLANELQASHLSMLGHELGNFVRSALCGLTGCVVAAVVCTIFPSSKISQWCFGLDEPSAVVDDPYPRPADEDSTSSDSDEKSTMSPSAVPIGGEATDEGASEGAANLVKDFAPEKIAKLIEKSNDLGVDFIQPEWTPASVAAALTTHGIDTNAWPKKSLEDLARELCKGKARFCLKGGELFRVVDIVIALLVYEPDKLVIQELSHPAYRRKSYKHKFGEVPEKTIKGRMIVGESLKDCVSRCLDDKLGFPTERLVRVSSDILRIKESQDFFEESLPGLGTLIRHFVVEANVIASDRASLDRLGLLTGSLTVAEDYVYRWESINEIRHVRKHLRRKWKQSAQHIYGQHGIFGNSLVPVMPWSLAEVHGMLSRYCITDCMQFCGMDAKDLHIALYEGKLSLGVLPGDAVLCSDGQSDGRLVCVVETISVIVELTDKQVIISAPHDGLPRSFLPSARADKQVTFDVLPSVLPNTWKLSNESSSMAALRVSQEQFGLRAPLFNLDGRLLSVIDRAGSKESCIHREYIVLGPWTP